MPEQITKYPEVTLKVLKGAGARCGEEVEQKILTRCPKERFCSLPTGEICVYGIGDITEMSQISERELAQAISLHDPSSSGTARSLNSFEIVVLTAIFLAGLLFGRLSTGLKKR